MRVPLASAAAACGIAAIVFVMTSAESRGQEDLGLRRGEVARLRAHFDSVLAELSARDVSDLRPSQRVARAQLMRALEAYRDDGVFPHNHDFPAVRMPYFRDEHGTLCAMAHLVASTGRENIVADVVRERNNAYIPDLAEDRRLVAWLDSVGLTVAEAARIQPTYGGPPVAAVERRNPASYAIPSLALGIPAFLTTGLNWAAPRGKGPDAKLYIGAVSGAAAAILGGAILIEQGDRSARAWGIADITVGAAALTAVVRRSLRRAPPTAPRPPIASTDARLSLDVTAAVHAGWLRPAAQLRVGF
ncbi:MAG: hypothetical protein M3303_01995 [Gemmatimonadota bacterium]|nr:hypothetical protein [Gemmatimonadota bacterium]